jgi:hypothetical protein
MSDGTKSNTTKIIIGVVVALVLGSCCCGAAVFGGGLFTVGAAMSQAEPVVKPMLKANENARVIELLGKPIEKNGMPKGNINLQNDNGVADYTYGIKGPKGEGTLVVKATKTSGSWSYEAARVDVGEESIDLLPMN